MKITIDGEQLKINYRPYNSGGKGGQHSNKTLNAIEATVILPDGRLIKANSSTSKSQHINKKLAQKVLVSRVRAAVVPPRVRPDLSERVRTYNACRDDVVDHASGEHRSYKSVMDGNAFEELVNARREAKELKQASK